MSAGRPPLLSAAPSHEVLALREVVSYMGGLLAALPPDIPPEVAAVHAKLLRELQRLEGIALDFEAILERTEAG